MYNFRAFRQVVVTFTIIWGEGFLPEVPQTCPKRFLCDFSLQVFSHEHHEDDFFGVTSQKGLMLFCKRWAPCSPGFSSKVLVVRLHPRPLHH